MTRLLLNTTCLVDVDRSRMSLDEVVDDHDDVAIAAVTAAELAVGVLIAPPRIREARRGFFEAITNLIPVIDYSLPVALQHAALLAEVRRKGRPRAAHDLIIAATARATERAVVTADSTAFAGLSGVKVQSG